MCYPDGGQATGGKDYQHSPDTYDLSSLWPLWSIKLGKNKGHFRFWQQQDVKGRSALETSWKVPPVLRSQTPKTLWISGTATHRFSFCWRDCVWSENAVYMQTVWPKVFGHPWSHTLLYSWSVHVHKVSCINKWLSQFGLVWMGTNTCSRFNTWWRRDWNQQLFNAHGFAVFKCPHTFGHIVYLTVLVFNFLGPCWKEECSL